MIGADQTLETADGGRFDLRLDQRFQEVSGTLDGRPLREAVLSGTRLRFTADLPGGPVAFRGIVEEARIVPDPAAAAGAAAGWRASRLAEP